MSDMSPEQAEAARGIKESRSLYTPVADQTPRTHEQKTRLLLGWIVAGVWVVAGAVIVNMIAGIVLTVSVNTPSY